MAQVVRDLRHSAGLRLLLMVMLVAPASLPAGPHAPPAGAPVPLERLAPSAPVLLDLRTWPEVAIPLDSDAPPALVPWPLELTARQRASARLQAPDAQVQVPTMSGAAGVPDTPDTAGRAAAGDAMVARAGFPALSSTDSACECLPPGGALAIGADVLIVAVNKAFAVYDRTGRVLVGPYAFGAFFAPLAGACGASYSAPFALYDARRARYLVGALTNAADGTAATLCLAVSADPRTLWQAYAFPLSAHERLADLRVTAGAEALYASVDRFGVDALFQGARVFAFEADALAAGQAAGAVGWDVGDALDGRAAFALAPVTGAPRAQWFVASDWCAAATCAALALWQWVEPFGANRFAWMGSVATAPYAQVRDPVPQDRVWSVGDWRVQDALWEEAATAVWVTQAVSCNPGAGAGDCVRWYRVELTAGVPRIGLSGTLGVSGETRAYPRVALDVQGHALLLYTHTAPEQPTSVRALVLGAAEVPLVEWVVRAGEASAPPLALEALPRGGAFGALQVDPRDGCSVWALHAYAPHDLAWGTWVARLAVDGCTPDPALDVSAPAVPVSAPCVRAQARDFRTTGVWTHTPNDVWQASGPAAVSDSTLEWQIDIPLALTGTQLLFTQERAFELPNLDGGRLEMSSDHGRTWSAVPNSALLETQYTGMIPNGYDNPLALRAAWVGSAQGASERVRVNLSALFPEQRVRVRWRMGTDSTFASAGWWISAVQVTGCPRDTVNIPLVLAPVAFLLVVWLFWRWARRRG